MDVLGTVKTGSKGAGERGSKGTRNEKGWGMRERERKLMRRRLDVEMRPFRRAGNVEHPSGGLLRAVRQSLGIPVEEITAKMGVNRSGIFDFEKREPMSTITLLSMARMAEAMGCKVVYGIVPEGGKTMEELAEERLWAGVLGVPLLNRTERERLSKSASQQVSELASQHVGGLAGEHPN
jgi:predicted DNA-binding mobile mystery protein A